jgi:hypothetical protein
MTTPSLRISGPDRAPYELGQPIHVHDGEACLGVIEDVSLRRGGSELHVEHFEATPLVAERKLVVRKLILLELTAFIAGNFPEVRSISFSLNKLIPGQEDGLKLAAARAALLHSIGAEAIKIVPNHEATHAGQFVVDGVWKRSAPTLEALAMAIAAEREAYARRKAAAPAVALLTRLVGGLRHRLSRTQRA